ncbi:MAG: hypothetical protein GY715_08660 [Planctomycetes bacterium]|nr:hypothetical protein [Planctomycetota bacterium]
MEGGSASSASSRRRNARADYSPVGSTDVQVEILDHGAVVASFPLPGGPQAVLGTLIAGPAGLHINKCGKLGGPAQPPCFAVCADDLFTFDAGPLGTFVGNELRLLSFPFAPVERLSRLDFMISGPPNVTLAVDTPTTAPPIVVAGGLPVTGLGDVDLNLAPDGRLTVSNIGSSGCDGVSIDLGESEGGSVAAQGVDFAPDVSATIDIYDDQCPTCPDPTLSSLSMTASPLGEVVVSPSFPCCLSPITVTVLDQQGNPVGSFSMAEGTTFTVAAGAGDIVSLGKIVVKNKQEPYLQLKLASSTGGDVTVVDPSLVPYANAGGLVIYSGQCNPDGSVVTRMCMTAANIPSFVVESLGVVTSGLEHRAIDGARFEAQLACEHETGVPSSRLKISNLGSSGCDGYSIAYEDDDDDGDGLPDERNLVGASFVLDSTNSQDDSVVQTFSWRQVGGPPGAPDDEIGRTDFDLVAGGRAIVAFAPQWIDPATMDVEILDENDVVLEQQTGVAVGTAAVLQGSELPGRYEFEVRVEDEADLPIVNKTILKAYFQTGRARTVGGNPHPTSTSVRVTVRGGGGAGGAVYLREGRVFTSSFLTTPAQIMISEEGVNAAPPPPCLPDLDGSGDVGFGDILQIIGAWGPCSGACPQDLSGNGQVDFADILVVIGSWGPCPI